MNSLLYGTNTVNYWPTPLTTTQNSLLNGHFIGTIHSSFIVHNQQNTQTTPILSQQRPQFLKFR